MRRSRPILFVVLGFIVVISGLGLSQLHLVSMNSTSMDSEPNTSIRGGDVALVTKFLFGTPTRRSLVVVELPNNVRTIRRVIAVPGDLIPNSSLTSNITVIPSGYYYLEGDSTNALDSRQLGLLNADRIRGRVLFVIK